MSSSLLPSTIICTPLFIICILNGIDDGVASFAISGTAEGGNTLSISKDVADPDGTGSLSYSWQISSNNSTWSEVGTSSTYSVANSDQGKKIRAVVSHTDNEGFSEQVSTNTKDIFKGNSNLHLIGRSLFSSFFTENFKNTDVYKNYILNQTFSSEERSGLIDLSGFTSTSETYTVTDLTFKLSPLNTSDIDVELKYSGKITLKK